MTAVGGGRLMAHEKFEELLSFWGSTQAVFACLYFSRGSRGSPHRWTQVSLNATDALAPAINP